MLNSVNRPGFKPRNPSAHSGICGAANEERAKPAVNILYFKKRKKMMLSAST
jgi:hypothetical protein